jgi:hypothetical protein
MTTILPADDATEYLPDRYDRLRKGVEILASSPNIQDNPPLVSGDGLRAFTESIAGQRVLDGLTDKDADTVSMMLSLDFFDGPARIAARIQEWICGDHGLWAEDDNTWAVCAAMTAALKILLTGLAGEQYGTSST